MKKKPTSAAVERLAEIGEALRPDAIPYCHAGRRAWHVHARALFVAERLALGLSLREIAEELGMAPSTVHRLARRARGNA